MKLNRPALLYLAETKNWSTPELANRLGINYSYLYRIMQGEKQGGPSYGAVFMSYVSRKDYQ